MPFVSLQAAVKPTSRSFGEYLDSFDGQVAINTAFMIGHSALRRCVRERGLSTLEEGVRRITGDLADAFGLKGRGRLDLGMAADIVVFDPETVGCAPISMRNDLPGDGLRLYADSIST